MGAFVAPLLGHVSVPLTNFAKGFRQNGLVADTIFPRVPVPRETDLYTIWDRRNQQLLQQTLRAPGDPAQRVRRSLSSTSYHCRSHAIAEALPQETKANLEQAGYGYMVTMQSMTQFLQELILLDKEVDMASKVCSTSIVTPNNVTLTGSDQWSDPINSRPLAIIADAKSTIRLSGYEANYLIIGESVFNALCNHEEVKRAFIYTTPGSLGEDQLKAYFKIENLIVARAVKVSAAGVPSFVFTATDALLFYSQAASSMEDASFAKTFIWTGAPGTIGGYGVVTGPDPDITAKTDVIGVDMYYDQKITATETAFLVKGASA